MPKRRILSLLLAFIVLLNVSPSVAATQSENLVDLVMEPPEITGKKGGTFELAIKAIPNGQKLVAMDVFLDFEPAYLEVVDFNPDEPGIQIEPGTTLTSVLATVIDNSNGEITYSAAILGRESPDDVFTVANITFRIKADVAGTTKITFHTQIPRQTMVAYQGNPVLGLLSGATVTMEAASLSAPPSGKTESPPTPASESSLTPPPNEVPESAETLEPTTVTEETAETLEPTTVTEETTETPATPATKETELAPTPATTPELVGAPLPTPEKTSISSTWWILLIIVSVVAVVAVILGGFIMMRRRG